MRYLVAEFVRILSLSHTHTPISQEIGHRQISRWWPVGHRLVAWRILALAVAIGWLPNFARCLTPGNGRSSVGGGSSCALNSLVTLMGCFWAQWRHRRG